MSLAQMPRLPMRWRITVWIVLTVLAVTAAMGVVAVAQVRSRFTAQIDEELRVQSKALVTALDILDRSQLEELAEGSPEGFGDTTYGLLVIAADGDVLAVESGPPDDPDSPIDTSPRAVGVLRAQAGAPFDLLSADGRTLYRAVVAQSNDGGLVVISRPLAARDEAVKEVVGVLALAGAVMAVLVTVTVAVVTGLVTRPLDAMIDTAEAIGEGDLTSRVPTDGVEDVARLATALNLMLDRLETAFAETQASEEALRRFVADASHELRTPLAAILGYAELHSTGMTAPDQVDRSMIRIQSEGERMRLIVEELLTLARLDQGRPWEEAPVDVVALVRLSVADAGAIEPGRPLRVDVPDTPMTVTGDAMSLRQVVDNLLANARAHTDPTVPVTVRVAPDASPSAGPTGVLLEVSDDGPGMDEEVAAHVFERFYRADPSRRRPGGSGLGLAIVAAIAEAHGGSAEVRSRPGEGATFTVRL